MRSSSGQRSTPVAAQLSAGPDFERCIVMLKKLWNDEVGVILSAELVLIATILVIGMIVGLV